jgi:hypothetical protein
MFGINPLMHKKFGSLVDSSNEETNAASQVIERKMSLDI